MKSSKEKIFCLVRRRGALTDFCAQLKAEGLDSHHRIQEILGDLSQVIIFFVYKLEFFFGN